MTPQPVFWVVLAAYPQLAHLCWNRPGCERVSEEEAFALYERNWRFVDQSELSPAEAALIARLTASIGNGVFLGG